MEIEIKPQQTTHSLVASSQISQPREQGEIIICHLCNTLGYFTITAQTGSVLGIAV